MKVMRYDRTPIKAVRTPEGYIEDTPVITRVGVFLYRNPDGTVRREFRPPEEVFKPESMASIKSKPVTNGHHGKINAKNVKAVGIGMVTGIAAKSGDHDLVAPMTITDPSPVDAGNVELSATYSVNLDETPGVWMGQPYDVVQRDIDYNSVAVVGKGRAGNARLNMDSADAELVDDGENHKETKMVKVKLKNGIEYEVPKEVAAELTQINQDAAELTAKATKAQAEADVAKADLIKAQDGAEKLKQDAYDAALAKIELQAKAKAQGIELKQDASDREIQEAVIKKVRGDGFDLSGKSDDYVAAVFDMSVTDAEQGAKNIEQQRKQTTDLKQDSKDENSPEAAKARMWAQLQGDK